MNAILTRISKSALGLALAVALVMPAEAMFGDTQWNYDQRRHGTHTNYEAWIRQLVRELCEHHQPSSPYRPHHRSEVEALLVLVTDGKQPFCTWARYHRWW